MGSLSGPAAGGTARQMQLDAFTAAGAQVWTKPAGAKLVKVFLIGGGGGGGSGARSGTGATTLSGGGGGGPGGVSLVLLRAAQLAATENLVVGAGGAGGAAIVAGTSDGNSGNNGIASSFGNFIQASPGLATSSISGRTNAGSAGGTTWANGDAGGAQAATANNYGNGPQGLDGVNDNVVTTGLQNKYVGGFGGDGGRSNNPPPVGPERIGGNGGPTGTLISTTLNGRAGGAAIGISGGAGLTPTNKTTPGSGGGGGTAQPDNTVTDPGGSGGNGGRGAGGGGGAGSAVLAGKSSGAGGAGGDGIVLVWTHF